ncbi:hypothetical protein [Lonsdalea quercina]|uniref:hypothetical protein n=1 Tax=Lonsdalea quercina TaxID=71657 RepID=UPI003976B9E9
MDIIDKRLSKLSPEERNAVDAYAEDYLFQCRRLMVEHVWYEMLNEDRHFILLSSQEEGFSDATENYMHDICYHLALCRMDQDKRQDIENKGELRLIDRGAA